MGVHLHCAGAGAKIAARARVHGTHQHKPRRVRYLRAYPRNHHLAVLHGLTQGFKNIARKLRQFVQKENSVVRLDISPGIAVFLHPQGTRAKPYDAAPERDAA
jgi:hypothetical protein